MRSAAAMKRVLMLACVPSRPEHSRCESYRRRRSEQDDVLGALDEGESAELNDLLARGAAREGEVVPFERLDRRQRPELQEHLARALIAPLALGAQNPLEELTETRLVLHRGQCGFQREPGGTTYPLSRAGRGVWYPRW